jgi:hypothetical protein
MLRGAVLRRALEPLLFLDLDGVLCLGTPYGWHEVSSGEEPPNDLWARLWHPPAVKTLMQVMAEFSPRVVLTTSWTSLLQKDEFEGLFRRTGLGCVADAFDAREWSAPQVPGETRNRAIERWLSRNRQWLAPKVVLDDRFSGTGLQGSRLQQSRCVVMCQPGVGLQDADLGLIRAALASVGTHQKA